MTNSRNGTALDPSGSVVVEACAGSGKTWLLVSRIVRLLLAGARPSSILAITFTRKAALEMQSRLRTWLRELARADDRTILAFLEERAVDPVEAATHIDAARALLESTMDAVPGITISTFHGWFLGLLQRAPLDEPSVGGMLEERLSPLLKEARRLFAEEVARGEDPALVAAFDFLVDRYDLHNTHALIGEFVRRRADWWAWTGGGEHALDSALRLLRQEAPVDPEAPLIAEARSSAQAVAELRELAELLAVSGEKGVARDESRARLLLNALDSEDDDYFFEHVCQALFKEGGRGDPFQCKATNAGANRLGVAGQERFLALHASCADRFMEVRTQRAEQSAFRVNAAVFRCGAACLDQLQKLKAHRRFVDFTDVEWRVHQLVSRSDNAQYMLHRLDARYENILVDEFQDTNPLQWQVLLAWLRAAEEAGSGPTVFLVGDPKQSIYAFRGADARLFREAREHLRSHRGAAVIEQNVSYRCASAVLDVVNQVFGDNGEYDGFVPHESARQGLRGRVELLPLAPVPEIDHDVPREGMGQADPLSRPPPTLSGGPRAAEAGAVALRIAEIVGRMLVDDRGVARPARYRDVMILIRKRRHLDAFEAALRAAGVPYVTSRQGGLLERLESGDFQALLRFLITPFADLDLARALRSPVFSCSDADLQAIAASDGETWWVRLQSIDVAGRASPALARARRLLQSWLAVADRLPVHDLLDRIFFDADVVRRYRAAVPPALVQSVTANLHAFLELALALDSGRYPSLPGFLHALEDLLGGTDDEAPDEGIADAGEDAVRLLTVHGAKGLEAPIVFVVDAHVFDRTDSFHILVEWPAGRRSPSRFHARTRREEDVPSARPLLDSAAANANREEANALYVAMTRAKQMLVVSGTSSSRPAPSTWYRRIETALCALGDEYGHGAGLEEVSDAQGGPTVAEASQAVLDEFPVWTGEFGSRGNEDSTPATERGSRIHWLLQHLAPPASVADLSWLRRRLGVSGELFEEALQVARSVLSSPGLQRFFDPGQYRWARNEVAYVRGDGELGRMDRVVCLQDELWVIDYKTGETSLRQDLPADSPWIVQLREYRAAASLLWPGLRIRTALIASDGFLHEIDA